MRLIARKYGTLTLEIINTLELLVRGYKNSMHTTQKVKNALTVIKITAEINTTI